MTTTVSLFWIILFVFIMHTALTYVFANLMINSKNSDDIATGLTLAILEAIGVAITLAALTL